MATPVTSLPLTVIRGVVFEFRFRYKNSAGCIDLDGRPLVFAYRSENNATALFEITNDGVANDYGSTFSLEVEDEEVADTGLWLVRLVNAQTAAIAMNDGNWWLRWQQDDDPANDRRIGHGPLRVRNP